MSRILVSLLSQYLQPNYLFIKEMEGKYDKLVFVSTNFMEKEELKSTHYLCKALGHKTVDPIRVKEDDSNDIRQKLEKSDFSPNDEYLINLTGATKVMSVTCYAFFLSFPNVNFYYIPEGKNEYRKLFSSDPATPLSYRMNLKEYFTINRLRFEVSESNLMHNDIKANNLFEEVAKNNYNKDRVSKLKDAQKLPDKRDKSYYSGGWFEEFLYYKLKAQFKLSDNSICKGAMIFREKSTTHDNEIDIMFIRDNKLYVFECKEKLAANKRDLKEDIEKKMYKLAAISKDFGLRVNSYIATLQKETLFPEKMLENINKRVDILGLKKILYAEDLGKNILVLY